MKDVELTAKAQKHKDSFLRHPLFKIGIEPEEFSEVKISETPLAMVSFSCKNREDVFNLILNAETGEFVSGVHIPKQPQRKR